jgi:hypothetical protein
MACATWLKFVMRHLAPFPTSEARLCKIEADRELIRAWRAAAMRLRASCLFISSQDGAFIGIKPIAKRLRWQD